MRDLELELRRLGDELDHPETRDLPAAVRRRLLEEPLHGRRRRPLPRVALVAAAIVLAVAGAAVAARFTLRGVFIAPGPTPAPAPIAPPGEGLGLGQPVTLAQAQSAVAFPVRMPGALGPPDGIFLQEGRVSASWQADERLRRDPRSGLGALFTQFRAELDVDFLLAKLPAAGTTVERVSVGEAVGFWIEGDPHAVYYLDEHGEVVEQTVRLAGSVLLWQRGDITYRFEADLTREEAITIARSLR